mmetsp:Transcript_12275/g.21276  ORF Transcript_12275/g.21276 Transcript_12275/m.21276 type:complete len:306 (-) Transcript_12275:568-1485(-)
MGVHSVPAEVILRVLNFFILLLGSLLIVAASLAAHYGTATVGTWVVLGVGIFVFLLALLGLFSHKTGSLFLYYSIVVVLSIVVLFEGVWILTMIEAAESAQEEKILKTGGIIAIITFVVLALCAITAAFVLGARNVTKRSLLLFNFIFLLVGVAIVVLGSLALAKTTGFQLEAGIVVCIGVFLVLVCLFGVAGAGSENPGLLALYAVAVFISFVAVLTAGTLAVVKRQAVLNYLEDNWDSNWSSIFLGLSYSQASALISSHIKAVGAILILSAFGLLSGIFAALILRSEIHDKSDKAAPKHRRMV